MRWRVPVLLLVCLQVPAANGPGDILNKAKKGAKGAVSGAKSAAGTAATGARAGAGAVKGGFQGGSKAVGAGVQRAGESALTATKQAKDLQPVHAAKTAGKAAVDINVKTPIDAAKATAKGATEGAKAAGYKKAGKLKQ